MKGLLTLLLTFFAVNIAPDTVTSRFKPLAGYTRIISPEGSFGNYLQILPLKPPGSHTLTFTGGIARTDAYTAAVVDVSIGKQDLQQCADAVMRLRGEYLFRTKKYNALSFKFTNGFTCDYLHYANGYRFKKGRWVLSSQKNFSYNNFLRYMSLVFSYAGTLSLEKELKKVTSADDLQIGDIFIHGGSPGHCFIVMDMAVNQNHQKTFMLAQSFMPAQNIQVLQDGSPWFSLNKSNNLPYGELINLKYLKRFE